MRSANLMLAAALLAPAAGRAQLHAQGAGAAAREMSTDRPDRTESPFTVAPGRVQLEMDLVSYVRHGGAGGALDQTYGVGSLNLKLGLLDRLDLELLADPWTAERTRVAAAGASVGAAVGTTTRQQAFGSVGARVKLNFWGNDGGTTAFGLLPFVTFDRVEGGGRVVNGGLILPFKVGLGPAWDLGLMLEADRVRASGDAAHATVLAGSASLGRALGERAGVYAELFGARGTAAGAPWAVTADAGVTVRIRPDLQLDGGVNVGLSDAADDLNPFLGISVRF